MKIKIENKKYKYITDDSRVIDSEGAFLLTHHNKKFRKNVEEKGCAFFLDPSELFSDWKLSKMKIIGITGTNGKTTITNIIAHILKKSGKKVCVSGTEGIFLHTKNSIEKIPGEFRGTPEILESLVNMKKAKDLGVEFFVMEATSHGIFQKRIEGIEFDAKVFTNLTQDHLDFHKTMEEYAAVKSSFFADEEPIKIINADDEWIIYKQKNSRTYSLKNNQSDLFAENFSFEDGISADIFSTTPRGVIEKYSLQSKMIGKFNLYNILASIGAVLNTSDLKMDEIIQNLADFSGVAGRMELLHEQTKNDVKIQVFSDYAHSPDAIENVLQSISKSKKIITIIGAGGDRDASKRPIMAKISAENSDYVFLTSDNPRTEKPENILSDMEKGIAGEFENYEIIVDRKMAIKNAFKKAEEFLENNNSVVVAILGKGDENYINIMNKKIPYSDKGEVQKYFKK